MTDDAQLALKADVVREALARTARLPAAQVEVGGSVPPWAYRTSMRFAVDGHGHLALRRARTRDLVPLGGCLIAHPALGALVPELRVVGGRRRVHDRRGRHDVEVSLRVSAATGERTALLHGGQGLALTGVPEDVRVGAGAHVSEHVRGVALRVSSGSFFQSGPAAAELLVDAVAAAAPELGRATTVVDAYGGVGLFAATAVPTSAEVVVLEGSASACAVLADPSRDGLRRAGAEALASAGAPVLVLVSCDPVALARDAVALAGVGYRHAGTTVVDLFPQTHHVEAVTRFERDDV